MRNIRNHVTVALGGVVLLGLAAMPAQAQNAFATRCMTAAGPEQIEMCGAALRYEPGNPELMRRMGDALLAANRPGGAYDAYTDALIQRPDMVEARAGRDEAIRQIIGRTQTASTFVVPVQTPVQPPVQLVFVPAQPYPPPPAVPVAYNPFDGAWSGRFEPRGQSFEVRATVVGGHLKIFYEDSTDRVILEGTVDNAGYFSGKGLFKDKNRSAGDGGDPVAISGRFTQDRFDGTGSAGTKATTLRLNRSL